MVISSLLVFVIFLLGKFHGIIPKLLRKTKSLKIMLAWLAIFSFLVSVIAIVKSPIDALHGERVKFLYIHVPAAWLSMSFYLLTGSFSFIYLRFKNIIYHHLAYTAALIGIILTTICIISGALWGYYAWGTFWVWDARLSSVALLFFLYLGFLMAGKNQSVKAASYIAILGLINVPIIKWSVNWWFTLHQPASISIRGNHLAHEMLLPLILSTLAYLFGSGYWFFKIFIKLKNYRAAS